MIQNQSPEGLVGEAIHEAPPPYTRYTPETSTASGANTPTSTALSSSTTRSQSLTPPPTVNRRPADLKCPLSGTQSQAERQTRRGNNGENAQSSSDAFTNSIPEGVMRARAPLSVQQSNKAISDSFYVFGTEEAPMRGDTPHINLATTNSRIFSTLYLDAGSVSSTRPLKIQAKTTNSNIKLTLHTEQPSQPLDIVAITQNSSNTVLLPRDFKGLLIMSTTNAKESLSPELQRVAVRVPRRDENDGATSSLLEWVMRQMQGDPLATWYEINGGDGPSRAVLKTTNAKVSAGFVGEMKGKEGSGGSCVVM